MVSPWVGLIGLPLLALHGLRRRPAASPSLRMQADERWSLPGEGRSDLDLAAGSRSGPGWIILTFADQPKRPMLLLRDQLDAAAWRALRLAVRERP